MEITLDVDEMTVRELTELVDKRFHRSLKRAVEVAVHLKHQELIGDDADWFVSPGGRRGNGTEFSMECPIDMEVSISSLINACRTWLISPEIEITIKQKGKTTVELKNLDDCEKALKNYERIS